MSEPHPSAYDRVMLAFLSLCCTSSLFSEGVPPARRVVVAQAKEERPPAKKEPPKPPPGPEPTGPGEAVVAALAFAQKAGPDLAPYLRFFWDQSKAVVRDDRRDAYYLNLKLLSTQGAFRAPYEVAPDVFAIDLRDYGLDLKDKLLVWERTADADFVFHQQALVKAEAKFPQAWPGGKDGEKEYGRGVYQVRRYPGEKFALPAVGLPQEAIDALRKLTFSESPILPAAWFFVQTARQTSLTNNDRPGIGQLDFLGIKTRDDFFALVGLDPKLAARVFAEWRAAVVKSGISKQNRIVGAQGGATGVTFFTLDVFAQKDRGIVRRNLLPGEADHDAEEWIGPKGDGLWATALIQAKDANGVKAGDAVASAPDKVGPDRSTPNDTNDGRVHQGKSCVYCHFADRDGLKPVDDWYRRTLRAGGPLKAGDQDKRVALLLESLYARPLDEVLDDQRARYARAFARATTSARHPKGLTMPQIAKLYAAAWDAYAEADLTLADACRELGVTQRQLLDGVRKHAAPENRGGTDLVLGSFLDAPPQAISRLDWEASYQLAAALALGLNPAEQGIEERRKDDFEKAKKGKK